MESVITLNEAIDTAAFYGVNNANILCLCNQHPEVRVVARGYKLKVTGPDAAVKRFTTNVERCQQVCMQRGSLSEATILDLLHGSAPEAVTHDHLILHGVGGKPILARSVNQRKLVEGFQTDDLLFAVGPAGSGKTYKIDPYLQPLYDALQDMLPDGKLQEYLERGVIQIAPLAFMRGRTLSDAVVILDEAQNATVLQLKMFLTRMGLGSKMIVTGDLTQIDLPASQRSGLADAMNRLKDIKGIQIVQFNQQDIVRHHLVTHIVKAYAD